MQGLGFEKKTNFSVIKFGVNGSPYNSTTYVNVFLATAKQLRPRAAELILIHHRIASPQPLIMGICLENTFRGLFSQIRIRHFVHLNFKGKLQIYSPPPPQLNFSNMPPPPHPFCNQVCPIDDLNDRGLTFCSFLAGSEFLAIRPSVFLQILPTYIIFSDFFAGS